MAAAAATTTKKIVVCGGNGFLGSRICKHAAARGWEVVSISRSGEPKWSNVTSSPEAPAWSKKVQWARGSILSPPTYADHLRSADYVVHSMGILLEADYKSLLTLDFSPTSGGGGGGATASTSPLALLRRAFSATKHGSQNPLTRPPDTDLEPQEPDGQFTYELMNRDSALSLARSASAAGASGFAYISAAAGAPVLPGRYIATKREAEDGIATVFPDLRAVFLRPPFLYDESRFITMPLAAMTGLGALFNTLTAGVLNGFLGAAGAKPMRAERVAMAVVEALEDEETHGPLEPAGIEILADRAWRRGML